MQLKSLGLNFTATGWIRILLYSLLCLSNQASNQNLSKSFSHFCSQAAATDHLKKLIEFFYRKKCDPPIFDEKHEAGKRLEDDSGDRNKIPDKSEYT